MSSKSSGRLNRTRSSPLSNNVSSRKIEPSDDSDPVDSHLKCDSDVDGQSNNNSLLEDSSPVVSNRFKKRKGEKLKDDMHLSKKVIKENDIDDLSESQDNTGNDSLTGATHTDLAEVKNDLEAGIKHKEEILRKLNMVKMYREKVTVITIAIHHMSFILKSLHLSHYLYSSRHTGVSIFIYIVSKIVSKIFALPHFSASMAI